MYNELRVSFLSKIDNVVVARTIAVGFLVDLNLSINIMNEIKTVISEAVTNSIVHGYLGDDSKMVEMHLSYDDHNIYLKVIDQGVGIENIEKAKEPLYSTKVDEERAGLGFTIMEVFTDQLEVESTVNLGTKVLMVKRYYDQG